MAKKRTKSKKSKARPETRKATAKGKNAKKRKALKPNRKPRRVRGRPAAGALAVYAQRGRGARSGGQAGDTQGLSSVRDVNSESVEELVEEGQSFEAEALNGVEQARDPDEGEVRTRQVAEDDVPEEYLEKD
jgi:hypothetical protein